METIQDTEEMEYILQAIGLTLNWGQESWFWVKRPVPFGNQTWLAGNLRT